MGLRNAPCPVFRSLSLKYPTLEQLRHLGARIGDAFPGQADLDDLMEQELFVMVADAKRVDPVKVKRRQIPVPKFNDDD